MTSIQKVSIGKGINIRKAKSKRHKNEGHTRPTPERTFSSSYPPKLQFPSPQNQNYQNISLSPLKHQILFKSFHPGTAYPCVLIPTSSKNSGITKRLIIPLLATPPLPYPCLAKYMSLTYLRVILLAAIQICFSCRTR
jgi:hypothetical protein